MKSSKTNRSIIGYLISLFTRIIIPKLIAYFYSNIIDRAAIKKEPIFITICNFIIEHSFYLLFFFVPLFMTPFNYELFEFNKMLLVYILTTLIVSAWVLKMVRLRRIIFQRTFWDIPLLIFFSVQFTSFLISINRYTSFWGYYSRFHGGLLSTICYLLLYWAFVSNFGEIGGKREAKPLVRKCLLALLGSAAIVSVYGILEHFGIDAQYWVQDVQARVFSTLGQPNWLAAFLVAIIPLSWALILNQESKKNKIKAFSFIIHYSLFIIFFLCLLYTRSRSGFLGFGTTYFVFWGMTTLSKLFHRPKEVVSKKMFPYSWGIVTALILMIGLWVGTPFTPALENLIGKKVQSPISTQEANQGLGEITESGDIRKIVWKGAVDVWKHWPIFGSGVETFAYSYYNFRPREHNDITEWDFLYNKAHNEYINFLATTGIFGLGSYLLLIVSFILWCTTKIFNFQFNNLQSISNVSIFKKFKNSRIENSLTFRKESCIQAINNYKIRYLTIALFSGFVSILVTNFFGFSVVIIGLFFFLFPALSFALITDSKETKKQPKPLKLNPADYSTITTIILLTGYLLFNWGKYWYADTVFAKGDKLRQAGETQKAFPYLQKSVSLRPKEPLYHEGLSLTTASLAQAAFTQGNQKLAEELTNLAIKESDQVIKINSVHLNFWKNRVRVFYSLAEIDTAYFQNVFDSLMIAAKLAPTDAKVFYNLGLVYSQIDQPEMAIETLEKTVELRPNYEQARYALALMYEQKEEKEKARQQLKYILEKINPKNEDAKEKLQNIK